MKAGSNSLPSGTFAWKGSESAVSVVPGWRPRTSACGRYLAVSMAMQRRSMLRAALDAR